MTDSPAQGALADRTTLITGAASGIGFAMVRAFLAAGARVAVVDRDPEALAVASKKLRKPGETLFLEADVAEGGAPARCFGSAEGAFGRVDVLVNNAGISGPVAPVEKMDAAAWRETLEINLTAPALWSGEYVRRYCRRGGKEGVILITASTLGKCPLVNRAAYCTSKLGLIALTRVLATELGPSGVRVNAICPGGVAGPRIERVLQKRAEEKSHSYEEERAFILGETPLGVLITPEDVAAAAIFLASDAARHITGEDLNVSGGRVMY
jgi:NAD(P)-dependent dehydrogenase (short-subunit alcohol dehydrogenase family)